MTILVKHTGLRPGPIVLNTVAEGFDPSSRPKEDGSAIYTPPNDRVLLNAGDEVELELHDPDNKEVRALFRQGFLSGDLSAHSSERKEARDQAEAEKAERKLNAEVAYNAALSKPAVDPVVWPKPADVPRS